MNIKKSLVSLLEKTRSPLSVGEILEIIPANKTTIYRDLESLIKSGKVSELDLGQGAKRYETTGLGHHHHLVCTNCKKIIELEMGDEYEEKEKELEKKTGFKSIKHSLEFYGLCENCTKG